MDKKPPQLNTSLREFYDSAIAGEDELDEASIVTELDSIDQRYSSEEQIAEGGMKQILKTHDTLTGRTVAKGIIKCKTSNEQLDKFVDEVRITAGLEHPNIIPVYDLGLTGDKQPYFTMKLIEGDDLQQILDKINSGDKKTAAFYDENRMLEIFLKVCDAVEYAHSKKIVHLDIKPANIQVGKFGEVLLCDWGLARVLQNDGVPEEYTSQKTVPDSLELSLDGKIKGSPGYMAPEQISDKFGLRSVRTDIYSLGALLFTMMTGKVPIKGEILEETLRKTLLGETESIDETVSVGLQAVIHKALTTEPEERYQSVNNLSEEIRAYISGFATRAENAGMIKHLKLMVKRHRTVSGLSAAFVIITVFLSSYFVIKVNREKAQLIVEQKRTLEARQKASEFMVNNATHNYYKKYYDRTTHLVLQAVELDSENIEAWEYLGYFYLGELKAAKALEALKNADSKIARWLTKKAEYLKTLTDSDGKVSVENAIKYRFYMAKSDAEFRKAISWHVNFTVTRNYTLEERIEYAEKTIKHNLGLDIKIDINDGKYSLDLGSKKKRFRDLVILEQLPLNVLNISHSVINDLTPIQDMPLEELNVSSSSLSSLKGTNKMPLKRLNISDSKIRSLHHIPKTIEVFESGKSIIQLRQLNKLPNLKKVIIPRNLYNERDIKELKAEIIYKD